MSVTEWALDRDRVTAVLLIALAFFGLRSYSRMPRAEDPGFLIRTAVVLTQFPGASPERVEELVTDKLETVIQEMPEIDYIASTSKTGVSLINVNIKESYRDLRPIWDSLRRKVDRAVPALPEGIIGPIVDDEFGDVFGTVISLTAEGYSYAEIQDIAELLRDELLLIPDAAKVEIYGDQDERVFIEYSNSRLADLGMSAGQIQAALRSRNIINPGGTVRTLHEQIVVEPSGNFESVEDIASTLIKLPSGDLVYLRDIASVERGYVDPPDTKTHIDGVDGLALAISVRDGGNIVSLGAQVDETLRRLRGELPHGVDFEVVLNQSQIVAKKVDDFASNLIQAVLIVLAVMLISLGPRTGLIVATLIPMAILSTFVVMPMMGVGIDQMSLAALIIALGLLVDNAIVMSESIMVRMARGVPARAAAVGVATELRMPLLVSSLTTAAAFLPIFLAESAVGEYTGALFKVVTATLLCSWGLALTMIPLLCYRFLRVKRQDAEAAFQSPFYRFYGAILVASLRYRVVSLLVVAAVFVVSLSLFRFVPVIFFPDSDRPTLTVEVNMPTGTPLETTEGVVRSIENFIDTELAADSDAEDGGRDGVIDHLSFIGDSPPMFVLGFSGSQVSPEYGVIIINTTTRASADVVAARLREFCAGIPGLDSTIEPLAAGPSAEVAIEVRVTGRDTRTIFALADEVKSRLRTVTGTLNVRDNWGARTKKFIVQVDEARAQRAGITHEDVATSLQATFTGIEITQYREGTELIPLTLRSEEASGFGVNISSLNVFSQSSGRSVPAGQVADIELVWQPAKVLRRDRLRTVTVQADLQPGITATEINAQLEPWLVDRSAAWPVGFSWELGGEDESSNEANASIAEKLPIAGILMVLLLVWQFNSIRKPVIIALTVPLAIIGVVVGLLVMRSYFGFMTLLGIISLAGIVINNAIVLIDRIDSEIAGKVDPAHAVIRSAQERFRPIMLTTFTTLGGMIPLYLGGGPMFETMAVVIMFGLVFATALTLGVVPILYSLMFRVSFVGYEPVPAGGRR